MIVAVLNGWSSSSRNKETRTASLVRVATEDENPTMLARRSMVGWARARKFRRFILEHQDPAVPLLCVGKSLGARNIVTRVLNKLPFLDYRKVGLVTIDPCWPLRWDWRPNLNRNLLHLTYPVDRAVNIYASLPTTEQAGAMLKGSNIINVPLNDVDHYSIVQSDEVAEWLGDTVEYLNE